MTTVVNLKNEPYDVYIGRGRGGKWGNPFPISAHCSREQSISRFRDWLDWMIETDGYSLEELASLHGKRLGCFCKPLDCHGDILAAYADVAYEQITRKDNS